jgi:lipopolysaccharide biosynthesis glycosyltransferase
MNENIQILIYTTTDFRNKIIKSHLTSKYLDFEINDSYNTIDSACKSRLNLFTLKSISKYNKILYLDTDILIKGDINKIFDVVKEDILYVLEEGTIDSDSDFWGKSLFGNEINNYLDKPAFTSGILLFNNCVKIKELFQKINTHLTRNNNIGFHDQPYIVYNAFKYNLYNNKILKSYVVNNDDNIYSNKIIHHFPGGPGVYETKIEKMQVFLKDLKEYTINMNIQVTKKYINRHLTFIGNNGKNSDNSKNNNYENKAKNISSIILNKNIKNILEIGFNKDFSTILMLMTNTKIKITCLDLNENNDNNNNDNNILSFYKQLKDMFGDNINIINDLKSVTEKFDLIHIYSNHLYLDKLDTFLKKDTILIYNIPNLKSYLNSTNSNKLWNNCISKYNLKSLNIRLYKTNLHDIKYFSNIR